MLRSWLWTIPLLLLIFWLSVRLLNFDALWVDEYWTIYSAGGSYLGPLSPSQIWDRVATQDFFWPPAFPLILSMWGSLAGWSVFAVRALSLFSGLLAVAWTYRLGRDVASRIAGLAAAIAMGMSAYFIYFLHEARAYSFYVFLAVLTVWSYYQLIKGKATWWKQAMFFIGALGLLYTNYLAALTLIAIGLYHPFFVPKNTQWWRVVILLGLAGILFLPWFTSLSTAIGFAEDQAVRKANAFTPYQAIKGVLYMFSNGSIALLVLLGFYSLRGKRYVKFVWFWALTVLALLLIVNAWVGVLLEVRYLLVLWPAIAIIAGIGVDCLAHHHAQVAFGMLSLWVVSGAWNSIDPASITAMHNPHWHLPWNVLEEQLAPQVYPEDMVAFLLPDWTWRIYHEEPFAYYLHDLPVRRTLVEQPGHLGYEEYQNLSHRTVADHPRLWVAYTPAQPTEHIADFLAVLESERYLRCATVYDTAELHLDLYHFAELNSEFEPIDFGAAGITLTSTEALMTDTNRLLNVTQIWHIESNVPQNTFSVGIHVDDANGQLITQSDYGLPDTSPACHSADIALYDLPPGQYTLRTVVYNWQTGERLPVTIGSTVETVDRPQIGTFTIESP